MKKKKTGLLVLSLMLSTSMLSSCALVDKIKSWFTKDDVVIDDHKNPSIAINGDANVKVGNSLTLTATLTDCEGTVNWTVSDSSKASISSTGVLTPNSSLTATTEVTVTATLASNAQVSASKTITIEYADDLNLPIGTTSNKITLSSSNLSIGSYDKNFTYNTTGYANVNGFKFEHYRAKKDSGATLLPIDEPYLNEYELEGMFYNTNTFDDIEYIKINYSIGKTNGKANPKAPHIMLGGTFECTDLDYSLSTTKTSQSINLSARDYKYLKVCSGDYSLTVSSCEIGYNSASQTSSSYPAKSGEGKVRFNPVIYEDTLVPGESSVEVPTAYSYDASTNKYTVTATKTYTYYTLSYVQSHLDCKADAAMLDPMDVCAYYTAFKSFPANYESGASSTFDSDSRQVTTYDRTSGYATAIPYRNMPGSSKPSYHEFDIKLESSYPYPRGVGRVVAWEAGFTSNGYDSAPVCVYTDDHYGSFLEYYNNGDWSYKFNATAHPTPITYSAPTTVDFEMPGSTGDTDIYPTDINLASSNVTLKVGGETKINYTFEPKKTNMTDVTFTSEHPEIASVDNEGNITAVAVGTTDIIIQSAYPQNDNVFNIVTVTVKDNTTTGEYKLINSTSDLVIGDSYAIVYTNGANSKSLDSSNLSSVNSITVEDDTITDGLDSLTPFILGGSAGEYTIEAVVSDETRYITFASEKNPSIIYVNEISDTSKWTITFDGNNAIMKLVSNDTYEIKYNSGSNMQCFRGYKSSSGTLKVQLYKLS